MSDNKLKIRINLQQSASSEADQQHVLETMETPSIPDHWDNQDKPPFDWRKITITAVVLTVLTGSAVYILLNHTKTGGSDETGSIQTEPGHPEDYSLRFNTFGDLSPIEPAVDRLSESSETKQSSETKPVGGTTVLTTDKKHDPAASISQVPAPLPKPSRATPAPAIPLPKPAQQSGGPVDTPSNKPKIPKVTNKNGQVVDDANPLTDRPEVLRAVLTHQIRHREPVDEISRIVLDDNKHKNIYFFVELQDLADQHVIVDWYFDDRHISETRLDIGGDHWRTNAQKLLRKKDIGTWEVTLRDEMGHTLVKRRFVVE